MIARVEKDRIRRIPDDEPVFILRAQDELASGVVREWCARAEAAGVRSSMLFGARQIAEAMDRWPVKKLPD